MSRQSNLRKQFDSDETFTRAAWDTVAETELQHGVVVLWQLLPHKQKGVWTIKTTALSTRPDDAGRQLAADSGTYPNARAGSLSAYVFALANTTAMMVESARQDQAKQKRSGE